MMRFDFLFCERWDAAPAWRAGLGGERCGSGGHLGLRSMASLNHMPHGTCIPAANLARALKVVMQETLVVVAGVICLFAGGAAVVWIISLWWLLLVAYSQLDRRDLNSLWSILFGRYRRPTIALITLQVVVFAAFILCALLAKLSR
jgi:hypothetical protein